MSVFRGERVLLRIFVAEKDRFGRRPLYCALLEFLREQGFMGATVLRGFAGFGPGGQMRSIHSLRLSQDLPLVVEAVDSREKVEKALPRIEQMVSQGLITLEKVQVVQRVREEGNSREQ